MLPAVPPGDNVRIHGKSQGYFGLPVQHIRHGDGTKTMRTLWTPTPKELEALNKGANFMVEFIALEDALPAPMRVGLSDPPS